MSQVVVFSSSSPQDLAQIIPRRATKSPLSVLKIVATNELLIQALNDQGVSFTSISPETRVDSNSSDTFVIIAPDDLPRQRLVFLFVIN
jgi:hypothetical protein